MVHDASTELFMHATRSAIRALAANPLVEVVFANDPIGVAGNCVTIPDPSLASSRAEIAAIRGAADACALRLRHHDVDIHASQLRGDVVVRMLSETLEQMRCEALGARRMPGVRHNIKMLLERYCSGRGLDRVQSRTEVSMVDALRLLAFEAFTGEQLPPAARRAAHLWREWFAEKTDVRLLGRLPQLLDDQQDFAEETHRLLMALGVGAFAQDEPETAVSEAGQMPSAAEKSGQLTRDLPTNSSGRKTAVGHESAHDDRVGPADPQSSGGGTESGEEAFVRTRSSQPYKGEEVAGPQTSYRVFTKSYDEVVAATQLCDAQELAQLRQALDEQVRPVESIIGRLANRLQRRLMAQQARNWEHDTEEGVLDAGRLARIVAAPLHPVSYMREKTGAFRDTVVSLLIDNSGSMSGRPVTVAAISADILSRTLERCGIKTEILGFTTGALRGGRSRDDWVKRGRPPLPGRLNDLRHIIYKAADEPWRRARRSLGLMLKPGMLKENIDGEALLWAHGRLIARPETRRILIVISDGAPIDDSTLSTNPGTFLQDHLRAVIAWIETRSEIELVAIGIRHDVARYYRHAVNIDDTDQLAPVLMEQLAALFDGNR